MSQINGLLWELSQGFEALLSHLDAIFQPFALRTYHSRWSWLQVPDCPINDNPAICCRIRGVSQCVMVCRSLQFVSGKSDRTWHCHSLETGFLTHNSFFHSRSLHVASCAIISAVGFIVSATISPEACVVSDINMWGMLLYYKVYPSLLRQHPPITIFLKIS